MIALRTFFVEPNSIDTILITHLHGDHFGGLPFFILDAQLVSKRKTALRISGPFGLKARLEAAMEVFFPGSWKTVRKFPLEVVEMRPNECISLGDDLEATGYEVNHPSGAPSLALRVVFQGRVLAYTGDTDWVDALIACGQDADLLIAESYCFERRLPYHLDYRTVSAHFSLIGAKRLIVTHMSPDMLAHIDEIDCAAYDGMTIEMD